jgi:hypothetical protein
MRKAEQQRQKGAKRAKKEFLFFLRLFVFIAPPFVFIIKRPVRPCEYPTISK